MIRFHTKPWSLGMLMTILAFAVLGCSPSQSETPVTPPDGSNISENRQEGSSQELDEGGANQSASDEAALPVTAGACANGLLPMEVGNQWVYALNPTQELLQSADPDPSDFDSFTWTVVDLTDTQATLEITSEDPAFTATYTLDCEEGAILTFPTVSLDLALGGGEYGSADLSYARGSGVFLPSMETLESNNWDYQWETVMLLSGEIRTVIDDTQEFIVTMEESPFFFNWSTAGQDTQSFESVEVIAGEFEALKLDLETNMIFNIDMAGSNFAAEFATNENQWYAPGVGLLQTQNNSATIELSGMSLPMEDAEGDISLMLVEFRTGAN
ncbi:MAG: hypothetical protein PVH92_00375 [Anaerolineales bacterium]